MKTHKGSKHHNLVVALKLSRSAVVLIKVRDTYCDRVSYFTQKIIFCEIIRCVTMVIYKLPVYA